MVTERAMSGFRPAGKCPLCGEASTALDDFRFAPKLDLPVVVSFEFCPSCNFVFAGDIDEDSYRRYYASVRNDGGHAVVSDDPDCHFNLQAARLSSVLDASFTGSILDIGCGTGKLLCKLADHLPNASLFGHDVANYLPRHPRVAFVEAMDVNGPRYDVIILSHVLEHLVTFSLLQMLDAVLAPGGSIYIETPNPFEYRTCVRREFMYYFDRLHVNHFSDRSTRRLLGRYGFEVRHHGTHRFLYRDGHYPAAWWIAGRGADAAQSMAFDQVVDEESLASVYRAYRDDEGRRAAAVRGRIREAAGDEGVLVYGAGDNFHRARWPDGPLADVRVVALLDRNADGLSPIAGLPLESPERGLQRHSGRPVVVSVSQESEAITASIHRLSPDRLLLFV